LIEAGTHVMVVGTGATGYTSKHRIVVQADTPAEQIQPEDFDALTCASTGTE
jgi:hypothetical protein